MVHFWAPPAAALHVVAVEPSSVVAFVVGEPMAVACIAADTATFDDVGGIAAVALVAS